MEFAARRFARRVLLAHLALLCVVLLAVGMAAKFLFASARQQVIQQAEGTQRLLARQTALGVQNYYESITNVLNLLQPTEQQMERAATQPFSQRQIGQRLPPARQELRRHNLESGMFGQGITRWGTVIWSNINDKAVSLFVVDTYDDMTVYKVLGTTDEAPDPEAVVKEARDWILTVKTESISPYMPDVAGGAHLVSVPVRANALQMIAIVPISKVERSLLRFVNNSNSTHAGLIDDRGTFISASKEELVGKSTAKFSDVRIREMGVNALKTGAGNTQTFEKTQTLDGIEFPPAMVSVEPVEIPGGHRWLVVISSGLADVDNLVRPIFHDALAWSIVLVVAVMAILISTAVQMIRSRLRLEREQMEMINKEMEQARQIQLNWLPDQPAALKGIDIAAVNTPASHVSGDFYNWFELPDGRIAVIIGDVTGHGMSAAFLMATTQLLVRTSLPRINDPGFCLEEVNRQLCTQIFNGQFVTMQILVIDPENRTIDIASSGHPPPLVSDGGNVSPLDLDPQLVMGVDEATEYPSQRFTLNPGAGLLLFTDGVTDAIAPSGLRFTSEGLQRSMRERFGSAKDMLDGVVRAIDSFRTGRDLSDDLTMVAVRMQPVAARVAQAAAVEED